MPRTKDPQTIVTGHLKEGSQGELITFTIHLGLFEIVCIANIPEEGKTQAPVYVKWKLRTSHRQHDDFSESSEPEAEAESGELQSSAA